MSNKTVTDVVVAGIGGQGVLKASDILSDVVFSAGLDVKKAEVHGMSQRGGSVRTDVRFACEGQTVASPMVAEKSADFLLVLSEDQVEVNRSVLSDSGKLITPADVDIENLSNARSLNVAMLGVLAKHMDFTLEQWSSAIAKNLPEKVFDLNISVFKQYSGMN